MIQFAFDPAGVNIRRVKALAAELDGTARVVRNPRNDGSPGVAMLVVEVPDDVTGQQAQSIVTDATGITTEQQTAWERQQKRAAAKASLRDAEDAARIATLAAIRELHRLIPGAIPWAQFVERVEARIDSEVT